MGHSSRKKKKSGSGSRNKGKTPSKDQYSHTGEDNDLLSEELTALAAIFQEDIKIISEATHTQLIINLRPYWTDMCIEELSLSALLLVRFFPGYPRKCPKLQIVPEKGLSKNDADRLLSLLIDQANINSREGRVMIFNLVEAAQEFLSEIAPIEQTFESVSYLGSVGKDQPVKDDSVVLGGCRLYPDGPSVCGSVDLYSDLCSDEILWGHLGTRVANDNSGKPSEGQGGPFIKTRTRDLPADYLASEKIQSTLVEHLLQNEKSKVRHTKHHAMQLRTVASHILEEETEKKTNIDDNSNSQSASELQPVQDSSEKDFDSIENEDLELLDQNEESYGLESDDKSFSSYSIAGKQESESHHRKRDLLMVHLLHLACSSDRALSHDLPVIASELYKLGMISKWAKDLSNGSPSTFSKAFGHAFEHHMNVSRISEFWKYASDFTGDSRPSLLNSRYLNDFEEIHSLGRGGFGHVVLCKNKLDGRHYAVKKIRLKDKNPHVNEKILREVATLSRLQHQHVVRYYQAWVETDISNHGETTCGSRTLESFSGSFLDASFTGAGVPDDRLESTYLYIQMEYCPRTLRQDFETCCTFDKDYTWHLFRQIVEGLAHIHSQGIIHRDLTPSNIFFDARNEIKIGDFGLAKFLNLEQLDHDQYFPNETNGVSMDGTGQVGTYFYTAPEIEQKWPQINEKVDMYSLGVVFFELWHPFATVMERHIILSDLKQKGVLPESWVAKFSKQSAILQHLMSPGPADRPSATDLLHHDLPPRMEDEWLNDILRALQSSDDSYVYDRVVSSIFDMKRLVVKSLHLHGDNSKLVRDVPSFVQYTEVDTELQDNAIEITKEVFRQHGAKRLEISPMRILDAYQASYRWNTVKLLTSGGDMLELCYELRTPFVDWVVSKQVFSFKRYEVNRVYRKAIGHSTPNRFYQGDFDIIGGSPPLMEAEAVKVVLDIATRFCHPSMIDIRLNHTQVLEEVWSWVGVSRELRQNVSELLSLIGSSTPHSTKRKSNWGFIRRQLLQDLHLSEVVVDRLQAADLRFCGSADKALARLRGALFPDRFTRKALEEISTLVNYLRIWNIEKNISVDVLMPPTEAYYRGLYFQILLKDHMHVPGTEATLMAVGGRYDYLVHQKWNHENSNPPGAVGASVAMEKLFRHCSIDIKPSRNEFNINVLVCSKGGGGLLLERMELVAELWQANMKAEFVLLSDPSLTEQYEYAAEHDIKCLIIITEAGLTQTGLVKVRHLELKKEKEIERGEIIKFLTEAASTQFRNLSIWN